MNTREGIRHCNEAVDCGAQGRESTCTICPKVSLRKMPCLSGASMTPTTLEVLTNFEPSESIDLEYKC